MANIKPLVARSVVVDCEPLAFITGETSAFGQHNEPRLFCDSCSVFGVEIPKALFAIDGGQQINDVTSPTAACTLTAFDLAGPQMAAGLTFQLRCAISPSLRTELETQSQQFVKVMQATIPSSLVRGTKSKNSKTMTYGDQQCALHQVWF